MGHARDADELLEVAGEELRSAIGDDTRPRVGVFFLGALDEDLNVGFGHRLADLPIHDGAAAAVQQATEVVEGPGDVEIGNIDVPMLVRSGRVLESRSFFGGLPIPSATIVPPGAARAKRWRD